MAFPSALKRFGGAFARFFKRRGKIIGKTILIIAVLVICALPAYVVNNAIGYVPFLFVAIGIALSGLYLLALRKGLEYAEATRVNECVRGRDVDFVLRLRNKTPLLFTRIEVVFHQSDLFGGEDRVSSENIILSPFSQRDFVFKMRFDHIGTYHAGMQKVVLHDLLGLFSFTDVNENPQEIFVLPRRMEMQNVTFSSDAPTTSTQALKTILNDGLDYSTVRPYAWGDPIKNIHWKLSSRDPNDQYLTRVFETCTNPGLTTVIDINTPAVDPQTLMQLYDGVIESAIALDSFGRRQGLDCIIEYADDTGTHCRFTSAMQDSALRKLSALLKDDSSWYEGMAADMLTEELNSSFGQSNVALCTSNPTMPVIEALIAIKNRRRNPLLLCVVPRGLEGDERKKFLEPLRRLDASQIPYMVFSEIDEICLEGIA